MSTVTADQLLIRVGHSPDPDDAFMFHALANDKIATGRYRFHHTLQDIETLNHRAFRGELELTAVSLHGYAFVTDKYALCSCGASIGPQPRDFCLHHAAQLRAGVVRFRAVMGEHLIEQNKLRAKLLHFALLNVVRTVRGRYQQAQDQGRDGGQADGPVAGEPDDPFHAKQVVRAGRILSGHDRRDALEFPGDRLGEAGRAADPAAEHDQVRVADLLTALLDPRTREAS
jgi:hypothetical protein